MSTNIDETDEKIIRIMQADSRKPFVEIAHEIGLSESAVRRRVKNLVESGAITPLVDKVFRLEDVRDALAYSESGRATGKVVIKVV